MAIVKKVIGKVPIGRGNYSSTTAYYAENTVTMYGMSFRALTNISTGVAPAVADATGKVTLINTDKWQLMSGTPDGWNITAEVKDIKDRVIPEAVAEGIAEVVANAPKDFDTLKEVADYIASDKTYAADINNAISDLKAKDAVYGYTLLSYNGGSLKESNVTTYTKVFKGLKLLAGVTIINNGVPILVAKNNELEGRIDILQGKKQTLPYDINLIQTINVSGDVDLDIIGINDGRFVTKEDASTLATKENLEQAVEELELKLENHTFSGDAIDNKSISIEKVAFASSVNLLDLNANSVALGKYISYNGELYDNALYNTTDFIPVTPSKTYQLFTNKKNSINARFVGLYNSAKELVNTLLQSVVSVTVPNGVKYMRITYYVESWNEQSIQVTEGNSPIDAIPYSMIIEKKYLPSLESGVDNFFVPKDIYVASGRTIELYYSQILLNYQNYNVKAECSIGASLSRKFQIKGDDAHIGDYPLTISVYNDNAELLAYATSTIHIVAVSIGNTSILPIGDSLTNGKAWLSEVRTLSNNSVTFVGTRKTGSSSIKHEGRSGASCNMYNTDGTYTYADNAYGGIGEDSEIFDTTKSYKVGDLCKYDADVYIFTSAHSGIWDDSHVRNLSQKNPFWDWENNQFSINHYKSLFGIDYNAIMIFLGTNGINLTPEANANGALGIKTLIENIRREDAVSPIIVINTIYRSGQNGIGTQGNTDGYKAQSEFKFNADRKVMLLAKAVENMIGGMDNVYICPVGFTHDSEYNFGSVKKEVNPRLTDTSEVYELFPKDSVHPQASGYMQMADEIFSILCAIYGNSNT